MFAYSYRIHRVECLLYTLILILIVIIHSCIIVHLTNLSRCCQNIIYVVCFYLGFSQYYDAFYFYLCSCLHCMASEKKQGFSCAVCYVILLLICQLWTNYISYYSSFAYLTYRPCKDRSFDLRRTVKVSTYIHRR